MIERKIAPPIGLCEALKPVVEPMQFDLPLAASVIDLLAAAEVQRQAMGISQRA